MTNRKTIPLLLCPPPAGCAGFVVSAFATGGPPSPSAAMTASRDPPTAPDAAADCTSQAATRRRFDSGVSVSLSVWGDALPGSAAGVVAHLVFSRPLAGMVGWLWGGAVRVG